MRILVSVLVLGLLASVYLSPVAPGLVRDTRLDLPASGTYVFDSPASATTPAANTRAVGFRGYDDARSVRGERVRESTDVLATKASQALRPLANNPLSTQKQAGHIPGTPQHLQRLKAGRRTSTFFRGDQAEELTRRAWANGVPVPGRAGVRDFDFGFPVGRGPGGGLQTRVRVHVDSQARIHGHPVGRELIP